MDRKIYKPTSLSIDMPYKNKEKLNQYRREYRKKNPEKIKRWEKNRKRNRNPKEKRKFLDRQNERRNEKKIKIIEHKKKIGKCQECGWNKHPEILQFHHKDKKAKKFKLSGGNIGCRSWKILMEEIKKCYLLCPNCHFYLHYQETSNNKV